jgi:hypothetical protein
MKEIKNLPASIHDRLLNLAKEHHRSFEEYFYYYVNERFLYRFVQSPYADSIVLKGGLMFLGWGLPFRRPTRDIDVQGYMNNSVEQLSEIVRKVCVQEVEPDGLFFDPESVSAERIMETADYPGVRVHFKAYLGKSNLQPHIDISFGNEIRPTEILLTYSTLLDDMPSFKIRGYPYETVIAEKFQTMVYRELANDRMRDFFDIYLLSQQVIIPGLGLVEAFNATFDSRNTRFPIDIPIALSDDFAQSRQLDWLSFLKRSAMIDLAPNSFIEVIQQLRPFLLPPMHAAREGSAFALRWLPGGPWIS